MATLRQAIERQREHGTIPQSGVVSVKSLHQNFRPVPSGSTRALLLAMFGRVSKKIPWAVILCRFKGSAPDSALEDPIKLFYSEIFNPGTGGLVEYWRDASLGAIDISGSRVFGWVEVEISRDEANGLPLSVPPGPGRSGLINSSIKALKLSEGDNILNGFLGPICVYTQNWSKDGAPAGAELTPEWFPFWIDGGADGKRVCLTPSMHNGNITAHEMGHIFGMDHDVGPDLTTSSDYSDPCCVMSGNGAFTHPKWQRAFGPAVCLPHLMQREWMYKRRVFFDEGEWMSLPDGITLQLAPISRPGARANLGIRLAFTRDEANWDYYLEYVIPTEWNQGAPGAPSLFIRRIVADAFDPSIGIGVGPRPAYLGVIAAPTIVGKIAEVIEPSGNVRFRAELTNLSGPILKVSVKKL